MYLTKGIAFRKEMCLWFKSVPGVSSSDFVSIEQRWNLISYQVIITGQSELAPDGLFVAGTPCASSPFGLMHIKVSMDAVGTEVSRET